MERPFRSALATSHAFKSGGVRKMVFGWFDLPGSSFEEVQKILKGYASAPDQASLDSLSKLVGLHKTIISRNNKFLTDVGLISGGMKKTATDLGKKLGRALDHKQSDDAQNYWREAVQTNEKVAGLVTTVRIKGGMSEKDFSTHVLYVSGQPELRILDGQLSLRNQCAHPTLYRPSMNAAIGYVDSMIRQTLTYLPSSP